MFDPDQNNLHSPYRLRDTAPVFGFGLILASLLAGSVVGYVNTRQLAENDRMVAHTHEVMREFGYLRSSLNDAETGQRGYLLVEDEKYLGPYNNALKGVKQHFARLKELTSDNVEQQVRLDALQPLLEARLEELKRTIDLNRAGDRAASLKIVQSDMGKDLMDHLRQKIAAMEQTERELLEHRANESETAYRTSILTILLMAVIGFILVGIAFYLTWRNITQRHRAAAVIAEQAERMRTTLASIGDAVITTDTQGCVTNMNSVAETLTGWSNAEAVGQPLDRIFHIVNEQTRKVAANPAAKALKEGIIVGLANHTILIAKNEVERFIDDSASPIRCKEGKIVGCVLIFRDISEKRRTQKQIADSKAQLTEEVAAMAQLHQLMGRLLDCPDLITGLDEVLDATIRIVGADMGNVQLLNTQSNKLEIVAQRGLTNEFLSRFRAVGPEEGIACARAMQTKSRVTIEDVQTADGYELHRQLAASINWHGVQSTPLLSRDQRVLGMISTHYRKPYRSSNRDLRLLDIYARQAADFIERHQTERALREYATELSEADRRKNEFLAMLAHELRNPLAPIANALQVIRLGGADGSNMASISEMLNRQVGHLVRLVEDLLDVSRISRGKIELKRGDIELASVINHAVEAVHPLAESMNHQLTIALSPQPIFVNGDPIRLSQIIGNLLTNACKFTERGGHIWLTEERDDHCAAIRVRDDGIGIAADQLTQIFEMFMQIDTSLGRTTSGLGIGLTLVKSLVEMHGGTVEVHSAGIGCGSEFTVRLPMIVDQSPSLPTEPVGSEPRPTTILRILVVDDNLDSATSLAMLLKLNGHTTHVSYDGEEAVEAAAKFKPDVILMDIGLPKLNGYEACRRIREQAWSTKVVLIALTGWGQEEDRIKSKEAGFRGHLVKPVEYAAMMEMLNDLQHAKNETGSNGRGIH